ncbi:MAG: Bax inhibitor-1/YccA family protein, partial [Phycisphaerales bacterium]|nr:Bax inhibitor-1/YccA family protein [Phycisphaerales bacterium]
FILTICIALGMLGLYYTKLLRPTKLFVSVVSVATIGVMMAYAVSFVMHLVGLGGLPILDLSSALQGGTPALIGLGLNIAILGLASLWLIIDFKMIEEKVAQGGPKYMEWYCGFALLVTLAWIYYEAVKLAFRLAIIFGDRD